MNFADSNQRQLFLGLQFHGETSTDSESDDQRITFNGTQLVLEQESESDYYASNDETDSEMVFEMDTNDMTDWLEENPKTAVISVTCGPKVLKPVTEAVLEKKNHAK